MALMFAFHLTAGDGPVLISLPHVGLSVPDDLLPDLTPAAQTLPDTDFQVEALYDFAPRLDCSVLRAVHSRYVVDLNRPPDDAALYETPTSGLVPRLTFAGEAIYRPGFEPDAAEVARRLARYWQPYHQALAATLERLRRRHGHAVLLDAHSIRSHVPRLFAGRLPDLNLGTFDRQSAAPALIDVAWQALGSDLRFSRVCDGRFRGGYITRHYGDPAYGVHAVQLELAQACYMDEEHPQRVDPVAQAPLKVVLERLVEALSAWRP